MGRRLESCVCGSRMLRSWKRWEGTPPGAALTLISNRAGRGCVSVVLWSFIAVAQEMTQPLSSRLCLWQASSLAKLFLSSCWHAGFPKWGGGLPIEGSLHPAPVCQGTSVPGLRAWIQQARRRQGQHGLAKDSTPHVWASPAWGHFSLEN